MSDTVTTVYVKAYYRPKYWIKIATGSFLKDNNGALYPIRKGVGITLDKEFWMPESGEAEFQLLFPPIPENVTSLDFSEGDFDGAYKIWGIQLNEKNFRKAPLPKDAIIHKINKKAQLPTPELAYAKATLKGKVLGFKADMPATGKLHLNDPVRWLNFAEDVKVNEDGTFQVQTDVITVTPATLVFPFAQIPLPSCSRQRKLDYHQHRRMHTPTITLAKRQQAIWKKGLLQWLSGRITTRIVGQLHSDQFSQQSERNRERSNRKRH